MFEFNFISFLRTGQSYTKSVYNTKYRRTSVLQLVFETLFDAVNIQQNTSKINFGLYWDEYL
jgi:hypothetical protein